MRSRVYAVVGLSVAFTAGLLAGNAVIGWPGLASASDARPSARRDANGITVSNLAKGKSYIVLGFQSTSRQKPAAPARSPAAPEAKRPAEPGGGTEAAKPVTFDSPRSERIFVLEVSSIWSCPGDEPCDPCRIGECTYPPDPEPGPPFSPYAPQARLVGIVAGKPDAPGR